MNERPILFSSEMVRAILEGRKTQTRRIMKPQPWMNNVSQWLWERKPGHHIPFHPDLNEKFYPGTKLQHVCQYGKVGDRLWVRETHYWDRFEKVPEQKPDDFPMDFYYRADGECCEQIPECQCGSEGKPKWSPSIFMPRWASRITLEIKSVSVERVQDITEEDANAEGCPSHLDVMTLTPARSDYAALWDSLNTKRGFGWAVNPWVWVIEFRKM